MHREMDMSFWLEKAEAELGPAKKLTLNWGSELAT